MTNLDLQSQVDPGSDFQEVQAEAGVDEMKSRTWAPLNFVGDVLGFIANHVGSGKRGALSVLSYAERGLF